MATRVSSPLFRSTRTAVLAALLVAGATLAPTVADARLGGGGSFGSRGGRTFTMPSATPTAPRMSPIERSQTAAPFNNGGIGSSFGARPGFFGGGFGRGLMGGFLGAGLFGLLAGHGLFGGMGGGFSLIGLLLQLGLLYLAFRFIMGFFRNRQPAFGGSGSGGLFGGAPFGGGGARASAEPARPAGVPITIGSDDYQSFERRLVESQAAYSNGDVSSLRRVATAEMAGNFEQELRDNQRQGVVNKISDVHLVSGDLSEAWREGNSDYATVAMRFSLIDVTVDQRSNQVVAGNPSTPQNVTEVWTFTRPSGAGPQSWALSAIQQA